MLHEFRIYPPKLYKYLSIEAANLVLRSCSLRWASPKTFNDPFDVQIPLILDVNIERIISRAVDLSLEGMEKGLAPANIVGELNHLLLQRGIKFSKQKFEEEFGPTFRESLGKLKDKLPDFSNKIISGLAKTKILCLSEDRGISSMWAHYCSNHAGAVLEFYAHPHSDSAFKLAQPVVYMDGAPNFLDEETLAMVLAGYDNFSIRKTLDLFLYTKSTDWSYEREWRLCSGDGRQPDKDFEIAPFFATDLHSVTFGLNSDPEDIKQWTKLAQGIGNHINFFQAKRDAPRMTFERLAV